MLLKTIAIGRLGRDPETKPNGPCRFSIACTRTYTDKANQKVEETEWLDCTAWGKLGELCQKFLTKGRVVYVEGRQRTTKYDKDGQTHRRVECVLDEVKFLPSGKGDSGGSKSDDSEDDAPASAPQSAPGDDDIPF